MTKFDPAAFSRVSVGIDGLFRALDGALAAAASETYPPYDLEQIGEEGFRLTVAVAGFREDELEVATERGTLAVRGKVAEATAADGVRLLHRGIARRAFERRFVLGEHVEVSGAALANGLLSVDLRRVVPEAQRPRSVPIRTALPAA